MFSYYFQSYPIDVSVNNLNQYYNMSIEWGIDLPEYQNVSEKTSYSCIASQEGKKLPSSIS